ncbi:MAG: type III secretion system chaperone [Planctomycetaceae bacterium]
MKSIVALLLPAVLVTAFSATAVHGQDSRSQAPAPAAGQLSEQDLGNALAAIGLKPTKTEKRYDFAFKTSIRGEEWKFSMSAVLSRNGEAVWVMAWLDQIPETASEVPRTALLRLLAANDRLGNGKFFAYIPTNKRFVLQRVLPNEDMSTQKMMEVLQDLAVSVADEYPTWAVANWVPKSGQDDVADGTDSGRAVPQNPAAAARGAQAPIRASEAASKFDDRRIQ